MGLDNGFQLKHKKKDNNNASSVGQSIEIPFEIAYFRKYFELDEWCMHHGDEEKSIAEITFYSSY